VEKLHNLPPYKRKNCTLCKDARGVKENYVIFSIASANLAKENLIFMNIVGNV
jgi:hypothetical protein